MNSTVCSAGQGTVLPGEPISTILACTGRLSRQIVRSVAAAAFLAVVSITLLTASLTPPGRPLRISPWIAGFACGLGSTIAGGILILIFSLIYRKSIAARPTMAGTLYGAAAGVAINADWRIVCPVSTLPHTLGAHGTAIVATMLFGALLGRAWGARRLSGGVPRCAS